ncbi:MAG: hypothetical protein Q8O00_00655 [Holophaga sp.]|nr:hypothetical protein [Holophaga sp.]
MTWRRWAALAAICGVIIWGMTLIPKYRTPLPLLLVRPAPESKWVGIDAKQRIGIMLLVQDALEISADRTVLTEAPQGQKGTAKYEVLEVSAHRNGDDLTLLIDRTTVDGKRSQLQSSGQPLESLRALTRALGSEAKALAALLPVKPTAFWELSRLLALTSPMVFSEEIKRAQILVDQEAESAGAHYALGNLLYRQLLIDAANNEDSRSHCEKYLLKALELVPGYPRAACKMVRMKTDVGTPKEALEMAFEFRRSHPRNFEIYGALAYAARNCGLLDGALESLRSREAFCGGLVTDPGLTENTYLYSGDLDRFQRTLIPIKDAPLSLIREFYRGYLCLLRGDQSRAATFFAQPDRGTDRKQFESLSRVYSLALKGQPEAALAELRQLRTERSILRVPDGEFTFKLAEAFAFLGQRDEAIDAAYRAYGQGFGCTRWYRESPMLINLRGLPRWNALIQHLQERQTLMELAFPAHRFGME